MIAAMLELTRGLRRWTAIHPDAEKSAPGSRRVLVLTPALA